MADLTWIDILNHVEVGTIGNQSGIGDHAYLQRYNIGQRGAEWFG